MDFLLAPFLFLCLNGCYGPTQTLRGQVERLPDTTPVVAASVPASPAGDEEMLRLAREIADPQAWAARVGGAAGTRPDLRPSRLLALAARGVPAAHLDALHAADLRVREADCGERIAEREKALGRRYDEDLRHRERTPAACAYPPLPFAGPYPGPYPGMPWGQSHWPYWR